VIGSKRFREDFVPRIGSDAVAAYEEFRRTLLWGRLIAIVAWPVLFIGIGLENLAIAVVGGILVVGNGYYVIHYGWGNRRKAQMLTKQYLGRPQTSDGVPISGNTQLFDGWLRTRATADANEARNSNT
jgi:hypothetical protein